MPIPVARSLFVPALSALITHAARCTMLSLALLSLPSAARAQCTEGWVSGMGTVGVTGPVNALVTLPGPGGVGNGDVIVGGSFVGGGNIARYSYATGLWSALGSGVSGAVNAVVVLPGGDLVVGGGFLTAGGLTVNRVARYNLTTGVWTALGTGVNNNVNALAVLTNGDLIAGGTFTSASGVSASRIARFNMGTGTWTALGTGANGGVAALTVLPTGDLIVGGDFTTTGGVTVNRIARYNPTTAVWTSLGSGTSAQVSALAPGAGAPGEIIAAGAFTSISGVGANRIARYNPTTATWSALGTGLDASALSVSVLPTGDIVAGGNFTAAGGGAASRIARFRAGANTWAAFGAGTNGAVNALGVTLGGDVVAGGNFVTAGAVAANRVARYIPGSPAPSIQFQPLPVVTAISGTAMFGVAATGGTGSGTPIYRWHKGGVAIDPAVNPSAATPILSIVNVSAGDVGSYDCQVTNSCGGTGVTSNAVSLSLVASPPPCPADLGVAGGGYGQDGVLDNNDFIAFISRFFEGCP